MRWLSAAVALALATCSAAPQPPTPMAVAAAPHHLLADCPSLPSAPEPPPRPRSFNAVVDWAIKVREALKATQEAYEHCRQALERSERLRETAVR